ncbi:DUF1512 family protein [Candidatus Aenigmatarchaeota archaeon]
MVFDTIFLQADGGFGSIIWFVLFFVFIFIYPRLMLSQLIYKIDQSARKMEQMSKNANIIVAKKVTSNPSKELKNKILEITDFFVIEPSSIDPYGIVKKIDQLIRQMEGRFEEFTQTIARGQSKEKRQELNYGLRAAISLRQLSKIVRHNVELAKKFKNLQIAMLIQMQLPIIEKIAESELKGTEAFVKGLPVGDSIGPLASASMMDKSKEIAEDVVMGETKIAGRKCFVLKATGPTPHLGRTDEALVKIMRRHKIDRIITIDAAQKLEGEKTGSVAEGVGFAMGGMQREINENILLPSKKPIDSIVVKVGFTEAIMPMKKEIYNSLPKVQKRVETAVKRTKKNGKIIIIGVGNSCGIGDSKKELRGLEKVIKTIDHAYKKEQQLKKKKKRWF